MIGVAWSGHGFVAMGGVGTILTSPDGVQWTGEMVVTDRRLTDIAWSGAEFTVVGDASTILSSSDGARWVSQSWTL